MKHRLKHFTDWRTINLFGKCVLSLGCIWWLPPANPLYSMHASVRMTYFTTIGSCDLKCLNNKREGIESLNWEGQRWEGFRHSSVRTPIPILLLVPQFCPVCWLYLQCSFIHGSKMATVKWLIYTHYNFQSNRVSVFQVPDIPVELHGDWITSEGIHSFLRQSFANKDITWSNHCDLWR